MTTRRAIYPGTFDPITLGHLDLVQRARRLFDEVVVSVVRTHSEKQTFFNTEERVAMIEAATSGMSGVVVRSFEGLLVNYAREAGATAVIRGIRAFSDFEYEYKMTLTNQKLDPAFETLFFMPSQDYAYINSNLVREIAALGGNIEQFVPPVVVSYFDRRAAATTGR